MMIIVVLLVTNAISLYCLMRKHRQFRKLMNDYTPLYMARHDIEIKMARLEQEFIAGWKMSKLQAARIKELESALASAERRDCRA